MDAAAIEGLCKVAAQTAIVYVCLMAMLRLTGRRQLGQLNAIDLLVIVLLGSAVETAMVAGNTSLPAGVISAVTLLVCNRFISVVLSRSRRLRHLVNHGPVLLIHDGHFVQEHLRRLGLTETDLLEALREREVASPKDVKFAVMESDGEIHVIPRSEKTVRSDKPLRRSLDPGTAVRQAP